MKAIDAIGAENTLGQFSAAVRRFRIGSTALNTSEFTRLEWSSITMNLEPISYSIADASRITSIGRTSLFALIREGRLKAVKCGTRTLIPAASLRALIEGEAA